MFGRTRQAVLGLLFGHPDESFYVREIVRRVGAGHGAVQRELRQLAACGILDRKGDGRQVYYRANRDCPLFEELKGLVIKTSGFAGVLAEALRPLADHIEVAFIYGSVARGEYGRASDVDLMVVGALSFKALVKATRPAAEQLGRELNATVYSPSELRDKLAAGHPFVKEVFEGPKVFLVGSADEFARLCEGGLAHRTPDES